MRRTWRGVVWSVLRILAGVVFLLESLEIITVYAWGLIGALALILVSAWQLWGVGAGPVMGGRRMSLCR